MHNNKSSANFSLLFISRYYVPISTTMAAHWADNVCPRAKKLFGISPVWNKCERSKCIFFQTSAMMMTIPFVILHISTSSYLKVFFEKFRNMILYYKKFYILYKWSIGLNFDFQLMINNHWLLSIWFLMQFFTNKNVSWINKNKTERYGKHCIFTGDFKVLHVKS